MTVEPINDPKLELLLADSLCKQANKAVAEYEQVMRNMAENLLTQATVLAALFLRANPHILRFGFRTSEGEYNDNGYDGYTINSEPIFALAPDLHIPEVKFTSPRVESSLTGKYFCTHTTGHDDCFKIPPDQWDDDECSVKVEKETILGPIVNILYATSESLEAKYGVGILYFDKEGMYADSQ